MRDGAVLRASEFGQNAQETILFLHGVMARSDQYLQTCSQLHSLTGDNVIALDLRGHGKSDGVPGDIRYICLLYTSLIGLQRFAPGRRASSRVETA